MLASLISVLEKLEGNATKCLKNIYGFIFVVQLLVEISSLIRFLVAFIVITSLRIDMVVMFSVLKSA